MRRLGTLGYESYFAYMPGVTVVMTRSASGPRHPVEALSFWAAATQRRSALSVVVFITTHVVAPERTRPGLGIIEPCLPSPGKGWVE